MAEKRDYAPYIVAGVSVVGLVVAWPLLKSLTKVLETVGEAAGVVGRVTSFADKQLSRIEGGLEWGGTKLKEGTEWAWDNTLGRIF